MNAGEGDLPRLVADLTAGRLTSGAPRDYVLLLQEAVEKDGDPTSTIGRVASLGLSTFFVPVRDVGGRMRGNAILSTRLLDGPRAIPLPRERQPRAAVAATVVLAGARLAVVSVHLENRVSWLRGGPFSDRARERQTAALLSALPPGLGIVGGDLNTWLGEKEPAWRMLEARFPDLTAHIGLDATFRFGLTLDHVFFDLPDGWMATRQVLADDYGSDHHPVLGVIHAAGGEPRP